MSSLKGRKGDLLKIGKEYKSCTNCILKMEENWKDVIRAFKVVLHGTSCGNRTCSLNNSYPANDYQILFRPATPDPIEYIIE